eukprot:TRINITY_DN121_c0_g1_i2.p1 TRINITY_DN121_c0_g1~~TRINITY_DN121_c0_g1_i2.p1  ORF type:complete len:371 (-),score=90.92 TRINITY_DN121_c0_g1_i2:38-1150(-)
MELLEFKIVAAIVVFFSALTGLIPRFAKDWSAQLGLISMANCFSAGIFLGAAFLHLLPESHEMIEETKPDLDYPLAFALALGGFLLLLAIEELALFLEKRTLDATRTHPHGHVHSKSPVLNRTDKEALLPATVHASDLNCDTVHTIIDTLTPRTMLEFGPELQKPSGLSPEQDHGHSHDHDHSHDHSPEGHGHSHGGAALAAHKHAGGVFPYLLLAALSAHAFFDGLAVGSADSVDNGVTTLIAILSHKVFEGLALGSNLASSNTPDYLFFKILFLFALASPLGLALGAVLIETAANEEDTELTSAVMQGLSAGTFLFVATMELLPAEFAKRGNKLGKYVSVLFGIAAIGLVIPFTHTHEHGHDDHSHAH